MLCKVEVLVLARKVREVPRSFQTIYILGNCPSTTLDINSSFLFFLSFFRFVPEPHNS